MVNRDVILLSAIDLADGRERVFTDLDLSNRLNITREKVNSDIDADKQLGEFLDKMRKNEINCDSCNEKVEIYPDIEKAYCIKCGNTIEKENIPYWDYCINKEEIEKYYIEKLNEFYEIIERENNRLIIKINEKFIAIMVTPDLTHLEDYYLLKGWAKKSDFYLIISPYYDHLLSSHKDKTNDLTLENFHLFYDEDIKSILNKILEYIKKKEEAEELLLKLDVEEQRDLSQIQKYWEQIISELPVYALQAGEENSKVQGENFQKHVINLLGLTIFNARNIGGPDNADGIILLKYHAKNKSNILYPVEVKSFKPKDEGKFCRIKDHEDQLRKYLRGYTSDDITDLFSVNSILMVAYDFNLKNDTDMNVIKNIKKEFGVEVILMPLKSLIRLVKLYFEKQISSIYPDIIEELLSHQYITENDVEKALDDLKNRSDSESDHIIKSTKEHIKRSP